MFNQSLEGVNLPNSLQSLTFGDKFNQRLEGVTLPSRLQSRLGIEFKQKLQGLVLPSALVNIWLMMVNDGDIITIY